MPDTRQEEEEDDDGGGALGGRARRGSPPPALFCASPMRLKFDLDASTSAPEIGGG